MSEQRGKFITLEGSEGTGKTTNLDFVRRFLKRHDIETVVTREPGGTPMAEKIRQLLLDEHDEAISEDTELLLMFASRAQHLAEVVRPALAQGKWVLCSRFTDSTLAYQGGGRGIAAERIQQVAEWVHGDCQPDLTLILDVPVAVGMARARGRGALDRIEKEDVAFFERVRQVYLSLAKQGGHYRLVDATQSFGKVKHQISSILEATVL